MARDINSSEAQGTQQPPSKSVWNLLSIQHILGTGETVVNEMVCLAPPWTDDPEPAPFFIPSTQLRFGHLLLSGCRSEMNSPWLSKTGDNRHARVWGHGERGHRSSCQ